MLSQIEKLLDEITLLRKDEHNRSDAKADRFNVFGILRITSDEVRLHSRFLAALLDPSGTHGQGTLFLDKFITATGCNGLFSDTTTAKVFVEYHIGRKTGVSGGRIDLLLVNDSNHAVIIENKIFASDQENQLLRYHNYGQQLKGEQGDYRLLYLTLDGREASDTAKGQSLNEAQYTAVSYAYHIRNWLEDCRQSLPELPKVLVALDHYIQLIDHLTGTNMDQELQQAIIGRITQDGDTFQTAAGISAIIPAAKATLFQQFGQRLETTIRERLQTGTMVWDNFGLRWKGMEIFHGEPGEPQSRRPHMRLSFSADYNQCYLEIHPGLFEGNPRPKDAWRVSRYHELLADHFVGPYTKVINSEKWQGEWVCEYRKLNNPWKVLIDTQQQLVDEIITDLLVLRDQFAKVETEAALRLSLAGKPEAITDFTLRYNALMEEMALRMNDPENGREIIGDGVHTPEAYFANPVRIAWMLKEPYDDVDGKGGGWNLYDMFNEKDQYAKFSGSHRATWHPITYATYALKNGFKKWSDMDYVRDDHDMFEVLKSTAFINAQKLPARKMTVTHFDDLHESLEKHNDLLLRQIELLKPNVLIFANTLHIYRKYLGLSKHPLQPHGMLNYIFDNGRLYIDAYHPAQRTVKGVLYNDDIVDVVKMHKELLN